MTDVPQPPGGHAFLDEPQPTALVGRLIRAQRGDNSADIRWAANVSGERPDDSTVTLAGDTCHGRCDDIRGRTAASGAWAQYKGPDVERGQVLERIVGRAWERSPEGRARYVLRCRSTGVHPDLDVYGTEDQVREWWPEQAEGVLRAYQTVCQDVDGDIRAEGEGEVEEGDNVGGGAGDDDSDEVDGGNGAAANAYLVNV